MSSIYERAQVYPLFAIMLTALIGVSALSVDIGYYRYQQRLQQSAADSAAIAGAQASYYDASNANNYTNAAQADASSNGFADGSNGVTVNVSSATDFNGDPAVMVTISRAYPKFFGSVYPGGGTRSISTTAMARLSAVTGGCLTSLGASPSITTLNGSKVDGPECGIADNGDTTVNGGTNFNVESFTVNASATNTWHGGASQFQGVPYVPDPCSQTPACQTLQNATAAQLGLSSLTTPSCTIPLSVGASPIQPGCYNNPNFSGTTLSAGLYVITGTAQFSGTVSGSNVTLYFANGAQYNDQNNANVTLSAPTSGTFTGYPSYSAGEQGMLMYQTPTGTKWAQSMQANITWTGLAYMPNWNVTFNGHSENITGDFVANEMTVNGGSSLTLTPGAGAQYGSPEAVVLSQ